MLSTLFLLVAPFSLFSAASALPKSVGLGSRADVRPRYRGVNAATVFSAPTHITGPKGVAAATAPGESLPSPTASPIPAAHGPVPFANVTAKSSGYHNALYFTNWFVLNTRSCRADESANNLTNSGAFTGPTFNHSSFLRTRSPTSSMLLLTSLPMERCK